jgi:DNA polymerase-1
MGARKATTLLVDGDQFLYRATIAVERETRWDEENHVLHSNAEEAWEVFEGLLQGLREATGVQEMRLAFTKGDSFRKGLYAPYKASRAGVRKPLCFVETRDRAEATYRSYSYPGLEADDVLGIWATRSTNIDPIIVSDDKDLKTIPGRLFRQGTLETVTQTDADAYWLYQTLIGDTADGYPGCPGIGPKTAEKLLFGASPPWGTVEEAWAIIVAAYEKAGLTEEDAILQARLARILRASDWDAENKRVILWTPSQDAS